jgi:hypothetical protein
MQCRGAIRIGTSSAMTLLMACRRIDLIDSGPGYDNGYENATVDGNGSEWHVLPPVGSGCYPRYVAGDGYVYDVHGHYYEEHGGHWRLLRSTPSLVRHQKPEVSNERRCMKNRL